MPKRANRLQNGEPAQDLNSRLSVEICRLSGLPLKELRAAWSAEFRREPPKGLWRDLLLRTLAWRLQEKAFGGHDRATLRLLDVKSRPIVTPPSSSISQ